MIEEHTLHSSNPKKKNKKYKSSVKNIKKKAIKERKKYFKEQIDSLTNVKLRNPFSVKSMTFLKAPSKF